MAILEIAGKFRLEIGWTEGGIKCKSPDTLGGIYLCPVERDKRSEPGWIRTIDTCLKRAVLCQTELRARYYTRLERSRDNIAPKLNRLGAATAFKQRNCQNKTNTRF